MHRSEADTANVVVATVLRYLVTRPAGRIRTLLMWIDGLDSASYALVRLLRENEDDVFIEHVHYLRGSPSVECGRAPFNSKRRPRRNCPRLSRDSFVRSFAERAVWISALFLLVVSVLRSVQGLPGTTGLIAPGRG